MSIEATFRGYIETTQDTLLIFEACRRGVLPRICRRLQEKERKIVTSGSVFVFDERESGIKRWTDGLVWSPSRILGNFLIYRELDKRAPTGKKDSSPVERQRSNSTDMESQTEKNKERALVGSLTNSYRFKKGGLIKKTMSIMVNGVSQHMISYYTKEDVLACKLKTPSSIPNLAILEISPEFLLKQNFRIPPVIESTYEQGEQSSPSTVVSTVTAPINMHVGSSLTMNFPSPDHSIFIAELEGMTYGSKQSSVSSPHAILPKPGTVSPSRLTNMDYPHTSRIKVEMDHSNQSGVDLYRSSTYSTGPATSSGYPSTMHPSTSHYTPYGHPVANGPDGSHTLPMPSLRPFVNRQPSYEFPPLTPHVNTSVPPRLLASSQPLIPSIGSNQNEYNNYYHSPPNSGNSQPNGSWSDYQFSSYSSSNSNHSHGNGSQSTTGNLTSINHQAQSNNNPHAETGSEVFYATATATGNDSATHPINTLSHVPLYTTPYHDLSPSLPELYNSSAHSPTTNSAHSQSNQHEHLATSPSPTLPAIASPTSTASTSNNNAPVTPPLSSPNTSNNATIVSHGNGGTGLYNSNYSSYYSSWIKSEAYPTVSMPSSSFVYDPYLVRPVDTWGGN
ncbi:10030_t:CDS:1 [Funneliformis caledonium]|uniref:10030_t:CDS:1 n=2 Tax=Funneliformis TaxID=1117308 RepID=A0A9N8VZA7_9GLOM|nr:10030_t:CDS:1 [Funneliformis caledonium]CAG8482979.1 12150_t:CDS:1 [Funneliformis mosseae]